eukprot:Blabericola_migrator_1__6873@NODE_347_length_9536_cov_48_697223_g279_i0_p7_GENE_NODE_347_length_9536_cov_48_697223_g279_i0NODE_347_length_9536_cov_48_697223_g279_i0_p7_ORF_typecomplete_len105_score6_87_NODE_347_length_9536_cov_48_697223_g279_i037024016
MVLIRHSVPFACHRRGAVAWIRPSNTPPTIVDVANCQSVNLSSSLKHSKIMPKYVDLWKTERNIPEAAILNHQEVSKCSRSAQRMFDVIPADGAFCYSMGSAAR